MNPKPIHSAKGIEIIRKLSQNGKRIFTLKEASALDSYNSIRPTLHYLAKEKWITRLKPGVYAIQMPGSQPIHEFEIAMALVQPAAISHWSAMNYYEFTEQTPRKIYATTTSNPPRDQRKEKNDQEKNETTYPVMGIQYKFIKTLEQRFFGHQKIWISDSRVTITNKERTLIDGLLAPEHCGGFDEVLSCYEKAISSINVQQLVNYSLKLDLVTAKRLGWILERLNVQQQHELKRLEMASMPSIASLNPNGIKKGAINKKWNLIENIYEE